MKGTGDIDGAIAAYERLKRDGEEPNIKKVADEFEVTRSRLSRRVRGVTRSWEAYLDEEVRYLTTAQEKQLVKQINKLTDRGIPPTSQIVMNLAKELCGEEPDRDWVGRSVKKYGKVLKSGYLRCIANERIKAEYIPNFTLFFSLLCISFKSIYTGLR